MHLISAALAALTARLGPMNGQRGSGYRGIPSLAEHLCTPPTLPPDITPSGPAFYLSTLSNPLCYSQ